MKIKTKKYKQNNHRSCLQVFVDGQVLGQICIGQNCYLIDRFQGIDAMCRICASAVERLIQTRLQSKS